MLRLRGNDDIGVVSDDDGSGVCYYGIWEAGGGLRETERPAEGGWTGVELPGAKEGAGLLGGDRWTGVELL